jgi:hypothetical protein
MKKFSFFGKALICCGLVLSVFLVGNRLTAQPVQAATASPCATTSLHAGLITTNETWCAGGDNIHYLTGDVMVQAGVTLTIAAGVTVDSTAPVWWEYLTVQGHLDIQGTQAQPVLMTRSNSGAPWGGIYFDGSAGDGSGTINYATIEKAGSNLLPSGCTGACGSAQTAVFMKDLPSGKQVTINNSTIRNNVGKGLYVVNSVVNVNQTTFSQNPYPIWIEDANSVISYSGNTFVNNTFGYPNINYPMPLNAIVIGSDALMGHDFNLPVQTGLDTYIFPAGTTIPAGRTVTVQPGVTVRTGNGLFTVKGHLDAAGTQALPIHFSGIPHADNLTNIYGWFGLAFDGRDGGGSGHLNYVTLDNAADNGVEYGPYALLVRDTPAAGQVLVEHSAIQDNPYTGVRVVNGNLTLNNSTIQRNQRAMLIAGATSQVPLSSNTFTNNLYNYVYIDPAAMTGHNINLTLQTGLNAYYFTDTFTVSNGRTLTVQPGVVIRTASSKFLIIQGDLQAVGSAGQPIKFSDPDENNYAWGGLIFDGPSGASGHLDHVIVEHGCNSWESHVCATLMIYNLAANKSVVVEHSTLQNSNEMNLAVYNSLTVQIDNNLIKGGRYGIYLATNLTVKNLAIIDQVLDGIYIETGYSVDARHLTIAGAGRNGFYVNTGGTGTLKNSILSHNALAVKTEGSGQANLNTNLTDANTTFKSGTVTELRTINGAAAFEADGYHIQSTSAAVGEGTAGLCAVDIDGNPRPSPTGSIPDLGADEIAAGKFKHFLPNIIR